MSTETDNEIPESIKQHLEQIRVWLDENVTVFSDVKNVVLHDFVVDWDKLSGSFKITVNGQLCDMKFSFSCLTATGKPEIYRPMFHSPLGAPASYAAVDISDKVIDRVQATIAKIMPAIKPLGLDKASGKVLTFMTPQAERLPSISEIQAAKDIISQEGFSIKMDFE